MTETQANKRIIRKFIRVNWDDQRLHDIYAFNMDGKMIYKSCCRCLLGVTRAATLHDRCAEYTMGGPGTSHYREAKLLPHGVQVELAYRDLGARDEDVKRRLLSAVLRAEIRRRDRIHQYERESAQVPVIESEVLVG